MGLLNTEERAAAEKRVREALGIDFFGVYSADSSEPECSDALLNTERELLGAQFFAYAEVWSRPGLDLKTRCFITLAAVGALTRSEPLAVYVNAALNLGISPEDILEALMQMGVYSGVAAASISMDVARDVFTERGLRKPGKGKSKSKSMTPKVPMTYEERYAAFVRVGKDLGIARLGLGPDAKVLKPLQTGPWSIVAENLPIEMEIAQINGQFGYGEIWGRPALGYRIRSFVTMATLQALNQNDQLHFHINNAMNLGITPEELHEAIGQVGVYCGGSGWRNATNVARDIFLQRGIVKPAEPNVSAWEAAKSKKS
jgi:4-carboxymuconolactone decarboxylase